MPKDITILAIESSCDETAAAVVRNGREVLSNVISSQIALHTLYGGVVPEIASRKHIEKITPVVSEALKNAGSTDPAAINEALWTTTYDGVSGHIEFDQENGDAVRNSAFVKQANTETGDWEFVATQTVE